jgi:hypothetical protein
MTSCKKFAFPIMIGLIFLVSVPVHAQFVTLARKIKSMRTSQTDVATVMIDAKTFRVYQAVIDTLTSNPKFEVTSRDNVKRLVEFAKGPYRVTMQVDSLAVELCQITVSAAHSDNAQKQATDMAVEAITGICHKLGKTCTHDEK